MDTSPFNAPADEPAETPTSFSFGQVSPAAESETDEPAAEVEAETSEPAAEVEAEVEAETSEPAAEVENVGSKVEKRPPTDLEGDVLAAIKHVTGGVIQLPDGKQLTPHTIAKLVENDRGDDQPVSTGAVSDCLKRWEKLGFVELDEGPIAFASFTGTDTKERLNELKVERREKLAAERAAAKAAKAAEKEAESADESTEPEAEETEPEGVAEAEVEFAPEATSETADPAGF